MGVNVTKQKKNQQIGTAKYTPAIKTILAFTENNKISEHKKEHNYKNSEGQTETRKKLQTVTHLRETNTSSAAVATALNP